MTVASPAPVVPALASAASATRARTWAFIDRRSGVARPYTCMDGCMIDHSHEAGRAVFPEDLWCWSRAERMTLPVNADGRPEEMAVLSTVIKVEPFSPTFSRRLPYAVVELVDDQFIENLDPDGYGTVINAFQERLDQMRATHARLVAVRAAYVARQVSAG